MNKTWQLQEAKSKFSKLVEEAINKGPQLISKRGVDVALLISVTEYNNLNKLAKGTKGNLVSFFQNSPKIDLDIHRKSDKERNINL